MAGIAILLVEDEVLIAQDEMRLLSQLGYRVCKHVIRADQAIAAAEEYRPDLVLMDIYLAGGSDGIEAATEIGERWGIPVVFATAYSDNATLDRAEAANPAGYVLKPFQQKQLQVTLKTALTRPAGRSGTGVGETDPIELLFETAPGAVFLLEDEVIQRAGGEAGKLFDIEQVETLIGMPLTRLLSETQIHMLSPDRLVAEHLAVLGRGKGERFRARGRRSSGEILDLEVLLRRPSGLDAHHTIALVRDVRREIAAEEENRVGLDILHRINSATQKRAMFRELSEALQKWLHVEAVGIRLEEDGDFPYYEVRGFPPSFVQLENSLCCHDLHGQLIRDDAGDPVLECMCGNVIRGRIDPSLSFFTTGGSFWTNSTSRLLSETSDEDRQGRMRNRCNGEGYESVALIPLSTGVKILGLIQLNDHRLDMFTGTRIAQVERFARDVATAVERFYLVERLGCMAEERERLLQQTHHRVNNNLQFLLSMLNVQLQRNTDSARATVCIRSVRNRISTIAHTHQALYETPDPSSVDLLSYLQELIGFLRSSYEDDRAEIQTRVYVEPELSIAADRAVPVGIVLSEILSNAFVHAFPPGRSGQIDVQGHREDTRIILTIRDDGVGGAAEDTSSGNGLMLARILVEDQLSGAFTVADDSPGTRVEIEVPII